MENLKSYFDQVVALLTELFKLIKILVNTEEDSGLMDVVAVAQDAGLIDAGKELGGAVIDAVK